MSEGLVMVCDVDLSVPDATRIHTLEVAGGFAAEGLDVDLVARGEDPRLPGVRYWPGRGRDHNRIARLLSLNGRVLKLLWQRRRHAQRLYVRHRWTLVAVMLAGRALGYRLVTQVDDIPYGPGFERPISRGVDWGQRLTTMLMARLAHGIVAITDQIRDLLVADFGARPERIAVLPNGVDIEFFRPLPRDEAIARLGLDPSCRYVVFCGHLASWVDFDTLLGAFAVVSTQRPDARLVLVGDGAERARVEQLAQALNISDALSVTGFVHDRARVRDYLAAATVTVASHQSAYINRIGVSPTKLAEYMAAGRGVIVKSVPGLREVVAESDVGRVVSAEPEAMAAAILELLDPGRADAYGERGRRLAEERFSWRSIVRRTLPLFGL